MLQQQLAAVGHELVRAGPGVVVGEFLWLNVHFFTLLSGSHNLFQLFLRLESEGV